MAIRAIRGATQLGGDSRDEVLSGTRELVAKVIEANGLSLDQFVFVLFTATPDVTSEFPALAARELGFGDVPLMCSVEMNVAHALPHVIRLMAVVETEATREQIRHVYLHGATKLRLDIAQ